MGTPAPKPATGSRVRIIDPQEPDRERETLVNETRRLLTAPSRHYLLPAAQNPAHMRADIEGFLTLNTQLQPDEVENLAMIFGKAGESYVRLLQADAKFKRPTPELLMLLKMAGAGIEAGFYSAYIQYCQAVEGAASDIMGAIGKQGIPYLLNENGNRTESFAEDLETLLKLMRAGWEVVSEPSQEAAPDEGDNLSTLSKDYAQSKIDYYEDLQGLATEYLVENKPKHVAEARSRLKDHLGARKLDPSSLVKLEEEKGVMPAIITMTNLEEKAHLWTEKIITDEITGFINQLAQLLPEQRKGFTQSIREKLYQFIKYHLWAQWKLVAGRERHLDWISPTGKKPGERLADRLPPAQALQKFLEALRVGIIFAEKEVTQRGYLQLSQR